MEHPNSLIPGNLHLIRASSHHSTSSIDLFSFRGEYGMGAMANDLSLGCDCLGKIHYLVRKRVINRTLADSHHSPVHTLPMLEQRSSSRMRFAFMKRMLASSGSTLTTAQEAVRTP